MRLRRDSIGAASPLGEARIDVLGAGKPTALGTNKHKMKQEVNVSGDHASVADYDSQEDDDEDGQPGQSITFVLPGDREIQIPWEDSREWAVRLHCSST